MPMVCDPLLRAMASRGASKMRPGALLAGIAFREEPSEDPMYMQINQKVHQIGCREPKKDHTTVKVSRKLMKRAKLALDRRW
jgi:hypothetical protein